MAYTDDQRRQLIEIFKLNATDVGRACKAFGINRKTFYEWYNEIPWFKEAVEDAREEMKDFGESQLLLIMKGIPKLDKVTGRQIGWVEKPDTAAIIFFNKTKNKDRGYDERHVIKPDESWPAGISVNVVKPEHAKLLQEFLTTSNGGNGKSK